MKRFISILILTSIITSIGYGKNSLLYLKYEYPTSNQPSLIHFIHRIKNNTDGQFILLYDNEMYKDGELNTLLTSKNFLESEEIYPRNKEKIVLDIVSNSLFGEYITDDTHIVGHFDEDWDFYIIVSDIADVESLCKYITISQYEERDLRIQYYTYNEHGDIEQKSYQQFSQNQIGNIRLKF